MPKQMNLSEFVLATGKAGLIAVIRTLKYFLWVHNQEIGWTPPHFGFWQFVINLGRVWKLVFLRLRKGPA